MNKRIGIVAAGALALALSPLLHAEGDAAKAPAKSGGKAILVAASEMKWVDPPNAPPGVKMAVAFGDPAKGPHGAFHKFPAGFEAPMHYHTAGHHVVVVSGTVDLMPEGEAAKKLGPGSYFSITGKKHHSTKCEAGAECLLFVDCGGAWDVVPIGAKPMDASKAPAKK